MKSFCASFFECFKTDSLLNRNLKIGFLRSGYVKTSNALFILVYGYVKTCKGIFTF